MGGTLPGSRAVQILGQWELLTLPSGAPAGIGALQHIPVLLPLGSSHSLRRVVSVGEA